MLSHRIGKYVLSAVVTAFTAALPLAVANDAAQASQCYGYYTAKADGQSKSYAINAAIRAWSYWVASHYGKPYAYWSHAVYPSTGCSQYDYSSTSWPNAAPYSCAPSSTPS